MMAVQIGGLADLTLLANKSIMRIGNGRATELTELRG
jgi:hypothetical protein